MNLHHLIFIKNKEVLNFTFEDKCNFCQSQSGRIDFSALNVSDLIISNTGFNRKLILGYIVLQPQLTKPFAQVAPKLILIFWGHAPKLSLSIAPDRPIYRVILFLFLYFGVEKIISLGWDVGGYKSGKNAFALATMIGNQIELRICTKDFKVVNGFYILPNELLTGHDKLIIAIDAPFGFPDSLLDFIKNKKDVGIHYERDSENVYAFRKTDLDVISLSGKYPLSPVFDKLGRNTLRVMRQLRKWKQEHANLRVLPWDDAIDGGIIAIEVYPGLLAAKTDLYARFQSTYGTALNNMVGFNQSSHSSPLSSFEKLYGDKTSKKEVLYNDEIDAAICALMGLEFSQDKSNLSQIFFSPIQRIEGVIYIPSFQKLNPTV